MSEINETQRLQLRNVMKTTLSDYLRIDNQINELQGQITQLKKARNESEKSLEEISEVMSLENEQLRYHGETINFCYSCQKPGLSNNLIRQSLENYLSKTNEWRHLPINNFLDLILDKISEHKDVMAKQKKKEFKNKKSSQ